MTKLAILFFLFGLLSFNQASAKSLNIKWQDGNEEIYTSFRNKEDAQWLSSQLKKFIPKEDRKKYENLISLKSVSDSGGKEFYVVTVKEPVWIFYGFKRIKEIDDLYDKYVFDVLTHATKFSSLMEILKRKKILARKDLAGQQKVSMSDPNVVYTMLSPEWFIDPFVGKADVSGEAIIELPLSLLKRDDWHISSGYFYGVFDEKNSAYYNQPNEVKNIIKSKSDEVNNFIKENNIDLTKIRKDKIAMRLLSKKLINEVIFQNDINLNEIGKHGIKIFITDELMDMFKAKLKSLSDWKLVRQGKSQSGATFFEIKLAEKK